MMKKSLLGALGFVLVGCVSITPRGSINIAYVPSRIDDKIEENEFMTELDGRLESKVGDFVFTIGGRQRTYFKLGNFEVKNIIGELDRQEYDIYSKLKRKNIEIYGEHTCSHPLQNKDEYWIHDPKTGEAYYVNYDLIVKFGIRIDIGE